MKINNKSSVSIVICTYNRDEFLERTLASLDKLNYKNFEVVVVNGPSTDNTENVIKRYNNIKIASNPEANLSISRNIGIRESTGDVVAFLDDDAIPEPEWLDDLLEVYATDPQIGGVGGRVYGPGGDHFQFHNGTINKWGTAISKRDVPGNFYVPYGNEYNIMMGVNSSFSREALNAVGGFDEYYEYFHDESDLCVRIINAGYKIMHHSRAYVHHEFAKSHVRKTNYDLNWYPIVKNTTYFGVKNSKGVSPLYKRLIMPYVTARKRLKEFRQWKNQELITRDDLERFKRMWRKGLLVGYYNGFFSERGTNDFIKQNNIDFLPFINEDYLETKDKLTICLLSKYYPPEGTGGIATYTRDLAVEYANEGHRVFVITKGMEGGLRLENGVEIHEVDTTDTFDDFTFLTKSPITQNNLRYSLTVAKKIDEINNKTKVDIVETPIWDYEGIVSAIATSYKTVVRLETPLLKAIETQGWELNDDLLKSAQLERQLIEQADGIITISNAVKETISILYGIDYKNKDVTRVPLGIKTQGIKQPIVNNNSIVKILFVGRLERRKGIDVLLDAFNKLVNKFENVELIIAGNNNIEFKDGKSIQEIYRTKSNKTFLTKVTFLGEVSEERLNELYCECDIFVAPSRYESFGLVFLEAMSYGKPVIGCDVGGIPEIVQDGINGYLVEPENIDALLDALYKLSSSFERRKEFGLNSLEIFEGKFSRSKAATNSLNYYKEIMNK